LATIPGIVPGAPGFCQWHSQPRYAILVKEAPAASGRWLAQGLRDAELVIFENSSRLAFIEEREAHIRVAEYFLGRVGAGVADEA
jgi:hypothetical protein